MLESLCAVYFIRTTRDEVLAAHAMICTEGRECNYAVNLFYVIPVQKRTWARQWRNTQCSCFNYQLNAQFLYSITINMLHYNSRHVPSNTMLIFRRSIVFLQHLASSLSVNGCTVRRLRPDRVTIPDAVIIQLTSWRWAWYCSKHVEDNIVTYILL